MFSNLHPILFLFIESVPSLCEFFRDDVTQIHKIIQTLLQCIVDRRAVCGRCQLTCRHLGSHDYYSPKVCIRRFIFGSEGCGIEYPQSSTSGLKGNKLDFKLGGSFDPLFHDHIP